MGLVKIDIIGLQTAQAIVDCDHDIVPVERSHSSTFWRFEPAMAWSRNLCRHNDGVAVFALHPPTNYILGTSDPFDIGRHRIALCGIEEVDACIEASVQYPVCLGFVGLRTEGHRPHADVGHINCAFTQPTVFHYFIILF